MNDKEIIEMYLSRSEDAIAATIIEYGAYCHKIADNILGDSQDVQECINDTLLKVWESIPPVIPENLRMYIAKITRNSAINFYKRNNALKRKGQAFELLIDELADCLPGGETPEEVQNKKELIKAINDFLGSLPEEKRKAFVCRYWYADSIGEIAARFKCSENRISVMLSRTRKQLKKCLVERGFDI